MRFPAVRRRFVWPADDLVTMHLPTDMAIDRALTSVRESRGIAVGDLDATSTLAVIGFPRSANTVLMSWLSMVALPGTRVVGGRHSHSLLDLHRIVSAGIPVLIPVRDPVDACASMMTRSGAHHSRRQGRGLLRAYAAWYAVAGQFLGRSGVRAAPFSVITARPEALLGGRPWSDAVDPSRVEGMQMDDVVEHTRQVLASVVGQGLPEAGVPAHLMISVPDPAREGELETARQVLGAPALAADRARAKRAYEDFMAVAELTDPGVATRWLRSTEDQVGSETTR